jgi:hypothetical protein
MTTLFQTANKSGIDFTQIQDLEGIRERLMQQYPDFLNHMKTQAVLEILPSEVNVPALLKNPSFIQSVIDRVPDYALVEKQQGFLAVGNIETSAFEEILNTREDVRN